MSFEDDILQGAQELVAKGQQPRPFIGVITSADPLQVVIEGTSVPLPALSFNSDTLIAGQQVAVLPIGPKYVILGALGEAVAPEPEVAKTKCVVLASDTAYGTSATTILTAPLTVGTWDIKVSAGWALNGATDQFVKLAYSGSTSMATFEFLRWTASANAGSLGTGLNTEWNMGQTTPQGVLLVGGMAVTSPGDLTLQFRRNAGTSALVRAGASIVATMVQ